VSGYENLDVGDVQTYSVDSNISADTDYYYRVRAYNAYGTSSDSNTISLTTACGQETIEVDTVTSDQGTGSSITVSHTTSGTNRLMLVGISATKNGSTVPVISSVTYNGETLDSVGSRVGGESGGEAVWLYRLVAPATGTFDVVANFSTAPSHGAVVAVATFTGVDQSTPLGSFASATSNSGTTASVDVPADAGELVFDTLAYYGCNTATVGADQTQQWNVEMCNYLTAAGSVEAGGASTLYEHYNTGDDGTDNYYGANWGAQTFTPSTDHTITSAKLKLYRQGSPGTFTVGIRATSSGQPTGADLCSGTIDGDTLTTSSSGAWYEISLGAGCDLSASTQYAIVVRAPGGDSSNRVTWRGDESSPTYSGGQYWDSSSSGSSWSSYSSVDAMFEEWGPADTVTMSWTLQYSSSWTIGAVPIKPAAAMCSAPDAPVATDATDVGAASFSANWEASSGATGYYLDVATDSGFTSFVSGYENLDVGDVLTYSVDSNISAGTDYYYRVRAYNTYGTSSDSNTISLTTLCLATIVETGSATASGQDGSITHGLTIGEGEVIIAVVHVNSNGSIADNNGSYPFTEVFEEDNGAESSHYAIYSRVAGASEPATYSWSVGGVDTSIILRVFSGVDTSDIWDVAPSTSTRSYSASGTTATAPSMTTSNDGAMGLLVVLSDSTNTWSNPTNGYGTEVENSAGRSTASYIRTWATAGSTGTSAATESASNDWLAHQIALKPAAGSCTTYITFDTVDQDAYWYTDVTYPTGGDSGSIAAGDYSAIMYFHALPSAGTSVSITVRVSRTASDGSSATQIVSTSTTIDSSTDNPLTLPIGTGTEQTFAPGANERLRLQIHVDSISNSGSFELAYDSVANPTNLITPTITVPDWTLAFLILVPLIPYLASLIWRRRRLAWRMAAIMLAISLTLTTMAGQVQSVSAAPESIYLHETDTSGISPAGEYMNPTFPTNPPLADLPAGSVALSRFISGPGTINYQAMGFDPAMLFPLGNGPIGSAPRAVNLDYATIAETGHNTNTGSSGTSISITHGLTINNGDVVVAMMLANSTGDTITDNNGSYAFSQAIQEEAAGGGVSLRYAIFYRVAGASEPSTYTWSLASSTNWGIVLRVFSGVDNTSVWDVAPSTSTRSYGSSGTTATAPSMTTVTPGAMGIVAFFTDGNRQYSNITNGYGTLVQEYAQRAVASAIRTWASAGATGTTSGTLASSDDWTAHQFALKPATVVSQIYMTFDTAGQDAYWYSEDTYPTGGDSGSIAAGTYSATMYFQALPAAGTSVSITVRVSRTASDGSSETQIVSTSTTINSSTANPLDLTIGTGTEQTFAPGANERIRLQIHVNSTSGGGSFELAYDSVAKPSHLTTPTLTVPDRSLALVLPVLLIPTIAGEAWRRKRKGNSTKSERGK
jgi:hypothetical protein